MPKQYGSNGINSDGSLMNVGNNIWDPKQGGKPSIKVYSDKNAYAPTTPPWLLGGVYEEELEKTREIKIENEIKENEIKKQNKKEKEEKWIKL
tara:strand:+ start:77 stop:355 length:279 start_codon:yes stop_codon:yes gene_type:complete